MGNRAQLPRVPPLGEVSLTRLKGGIAKMVWDRCDFLARIGEKVWDFVGA